MTLAASIEVKLVLGDDTYNVDLTLPSAAPTGTAPFRFDVTSTPKDASNTATSDTLLAVAIGGAHEIYVAVAPPSSLLKTAGVGDLVQQLQVVVQDGDYDIEKHQFKPAA